MVVGTALEVTACNIVSVDTTATVAALVTGRMLS
jgi:hypothetical protein